MLQFKLIIVGLGLIVFGAACLAAPLALPDESDVSSLWPFDGVLAIAGGVFVITWSTKLSNESKDAHGKDDDPGAP